MKILSAFAIVFSLLGAANVVMAQDYTGHGGVVTGSQSNAAANSSGDYEYGSKSGR